MAAAAEMTTTKVEIWTDGACVNNGKQGAVAGIGVWFGKDDPRNVSERLPGDTQTNNRAELFAIQRALEITMLSCTEGEKYVVFSDSEYAVKAQTVWIINWRANGWRTTRGRGSVKNRDLIEGIDHLFYTFARKHVQVQLRWVRGHCGHVGNESADSLATRACKITDDESPQVKRPRIDEEGEKKGVRLE